MNCYYFVKRKKPEEKLCIRWLACLTYNAACDYCKDSFGFVMRTICSFH